MSAGIGRLWELRGRIGNPDYEAYKAEVLSGEGLVLALFFDEGRGDRVIDASGKGNHGTIYGARWTKRNGVWSLSLDDVNDYVDCGNDTSLDCTNAITIEIWAKVKGLTGDHQYLVSKTMYAYGFLFRPNLDEFGLWARLNGTWQPIVIVEMTFEVDRWYHMAASWDIAGGPGELFIDGVLRNSNSLSGTLGTTAYHLFIGAYEPERYCFYGLTSEVRIYNRALSADEIARHWQLGLPFHQA